MRWPLFSQWLLLGQLFLVLSSGEATQGGGYKDASLPAEARVADLLSRMSIEDKMSQLMQGDLANWLNTTSGAFNYSGLVENMKTKAGMFYVGHDISFSWLADNIKKGQDYLLHNTTLGIPALVQTEGLHGFLLQNATVFNSPIGFGSSWNRELVRKMANVIAVEARALGVTQLFAPMSDLARELRYGRVEETISEDPYLAGEIGYEYVVGLQSHNVSATVKQFAAYSQPEQGLNTGPVRGGERLLRTTWLPSYKRAIIDGGSWSVMGAYSCYDGIPEVADYHTLTEILRDEWGYKYFVISDSGATSRLCDVFRTCRSNPFDKESVVMQALTAGTDVEMGGGVFTYVTIPELVQSGRLNEDVVNTAVSRLLLAKFEMGLFENPYPAAPPSQWGNLIDTPAHKKVARDLDKESIILLENHNKTLPLKKSGNIALIGPFASGYMNYGDYVVYNDKYRGVTPLAGIKAAVGNTTIVHYAEGCKPWSNNQSGFQEAIDAAKKSDVAIVVVGTWSRDQRQLWEGLNATTGEHVDENNLDLVGAQGALVRAVHDTGVPTVVVFSSGKPTTDLWISNHTAALVQQFYPSQEGGNALADVLFGDYNPSGRLSVSFPKFVGDLPINYDYITSGREISNSGQMFANGTLEFGHQYVLGSPMPWYPFGYGKSYVEFKYSNVRINMTEVCPDDTVKISVDVTNTDKSRHGTEVVQVYIIDNIASVAVPNIQLKGFDKVFIPANSTRTVHIPIRVSDLGLWNVRMQYVVEPGLFTALVGGDSQDYKGNVTFTVR